MVLDLFFLIRQTPRQRIILDKLIVIQLIKKFTALYEKRRFVIVFTRLRDWTVI
jgi:hypothetical protein